MNSADRKCGNPVAEQSRVTKAEGRYRQDNLKGTVIIKGDIVKPVLPEEDWEAMHEKPDSSAYLDEDERELKEVIELGGYEPGSSQMTPQLLQNLREAARRTVAGRSREFSCVNQDGFDEQ